MFNSKIALSLASIAAAGALVVGATFAFFSDTETSTGNTFAAGDLDLQVDSECHYFQNDSPVSCINNQDVAFGTWTLSDLVPGVHKFFNFDDLKPGDHGEDTISLHVFDNDAWARIFINNVQDLDNTCPENEIAAEPLCELSPDGELREALLFQLWLDQGLTPGFQNDADPGEGDNVWQEANEPLRFSQHTIDATEETHNLWEFLADAHTAFSCDNPIPCPGLTADGQFIASITYYFGFGWELPDDTGNNVLTDSLGADITIEVEQYRNNPVPFGP